MRVAHHFPDAARTLLTEAVQRFDHLHQTMGQRKGDSGKKVTTTTVLSAKEETVDAAVFNIPADYKETPSPMFPSPRRDASPEPQK